MKRLLISLSILSLLVFAATYAIAQAPVHIKMATTTSTEDTGLLTVLLPAFEKKTGIKVDAIAVGTGKALKLAENGDVDVVLVHAPEQEKQFVLAGFGVERIPVMHNDFIVAGPKNDPAGVKNTKSVGEAFAAIAKAEKPFVSRGDASGTHTKEKEIWKAAGATPTGKWYIEAGQGMGATMRIADEKQGYVLCDRATFNALAATISLVIVREGDSGLLNPYHVIAVNPQKHTQTKIKEVQIFIQWLTGDEGQQIIGTFKKNNQILFIPDAKPLTK